MSARGMKGRNRLNSNLNEIQPIRNKLKEWRKTITTGNQSIFSIGNIISSNILIIKVRQDDMGRYVSRRALSSYGFPPWRRSYNQYANPTSLANCVYPVR